MIVTFVKVIMKKKLFICFGIFYLLLNITGFLFRATPCYATEEKPALSAPVAEKTAENSGAAISAPEKTHQDPGNAVTLSGRIVDGEGEPIEDAVVACNVFPFAGAVSDDDGVFRLQVAPSDDPFALEIIKEGYFPLYAPVASLLPKDKMPAEFVLTTVSEPAVLPGGNAPAPGQDIVHIEADTLSYEHDTDIYHARGNVIITYTGGVLSAAMVDLNHKTNEAVAEGQVVMQSKDGDVLEGEKGRLDIGTKTGVVDEGRVFMPSSHMYIRGDRIEKRGDTTYFVVNATITPCDGESPAWHLAGKELDVTVEGYGTMTQSRFYADKMPVFYTPYTVFPVKAKRQTGFLLPTRMSYSQNKLGWDVSIPFFWAISENTDATFHQRYMSERGFQEGIEFRYAMTPTSFGTIYGDFLNDTKKVTETIGNISRDWQTEQKRWAFYLNHQSTFDRTLLLRADIAKVSDSFYFKDFTAYNYFLANYAQFRPQPFRQITFMGDEALSFLDSTVRLTKTWKAYSLTAQVKSTQDLTVRSNDITLQRYPEITLTGIKQKLFGTKINYELSGVYDYFFRDVGQKGNLMDIYPTLSLPWSFKDYFQVTTFTGVRSLAWNRDDNVDDGAGKQGHREVYTVGATMSSEIQRVFNVGGERLDRLRHAIIPELTYIYSPYTRQENIPDFVATATQQNAVTSALAKVLSGQSGVTASDQNSFTYGLTNTLMAKFKEKGGKRYAELLRLKLAQTYNIKEANRADTVNEIRSPLSKITVDLDFKPIPYVTFIARNIYSVYTTNWTQANYDLSVSDKRGDSIAVTYRYTQNVVDLQDSRNNQAGIEETNLILTAKVTKSLDLIFRMKRDHLNDRNIERTYGFNYKSQCWTVGFDYGDRTDGAGQTDRIYAIRFSLYGM